MLDRNQHEVVLKKILFDIYNDCDLSPLLGFKGGTAAYLFYGLNRFSVDLDFDLLEEDKSEVVFEKIKKIVSQYGTIKDEKMKYFTIYFMLSYAQQLQNVKVEISTRVGSKNRYELYNYLGLPIKTMTKDCMVSNKLLAVMDRKNFASRDLFDAHFFLKNGWEVNEEIIKERTGKTKKEYFAQLVRFLKKKEGKLSILFGLGELVDSKQKSFIKTKLLKELIYLLEIQG